MKNTWERKMSALKNKLKRLKKLSPEASQIANEVLRECRQREREQEAEVARCQKELKSIKAERTKSKTAIRHDAVKPLQQELHRFGLQVDNTRNSSEVNVFYRRRMRRIAGGLLGS
jgi:hypothetical protein